MLVQSTIRPISFKIIRNVTNMENKSIANAEMSYETKYNSSWLTVNRANGKFSLLVS